MTRQWFVGWYVVECVGLVDLLLGKGVYTLQNVSTLIFVLKEEGLFQRRSSINDR